MKIPIAMLTLAFVPLIGVAHADARDRDLPGVSLPDPIVAAPPPEPSAEDQDPRTFRIGNTDFRISGDITVDVIIGDIKPSPRR